MPLNKQNCRTFHRRLYAGQIKSIVLLKRNDNQEQGITTEYTLYQCRRTSHVKTAETIQGDMSALHQTVWQIPVSELQRFEIHWLNPLDRIVETTDDSRNPLPRPRYWQPEGTTNIDVRLFEDQIFLHCLRVDPPLGEPTQKFMVQVDVSSNDERTQLVSYLEGQGYEVRFITELQVQFEVASEQVQTAVVTTLIGLDYDAEALTIWV